MNNIFLTQACHLKMLSVSFETRGCAGVAGLAPTLPELTPDHGQHQSRRKCRESTIEKLLC